MKRLKDIKIGTQLQLGFAVMLLLVIVLGAIAYQQTNKIHQQNETMYNHPHKVRRAIGELKFNIASIHRKMKDLFLTDSESSISATLEQNEIYKTIAGSQVEILL